MQSLAFKYGIPADSDLVFGCTFSAKSLFAFQELKENDGQRRTCQYYVMSFEESRTFLKKLVDMPEFRFPHYIKRGKIVLSSASAATGGKHRSVTLTNALTMPLERMDTPSFSSIMTLKRTADTRNKQKTERRGKFVIFVLRLKVSCPSFWKWKTL